MSRIDCNEIVKRMEERLSADYQIELHEASTVQLHNALAEAVMAEFAPIQARYNEIIADQEGLNAMLKAHAERAQALAQTFVGSHTQAPFVRISCASAS